MDAAIKTSKADIVQYVKNKSLYEVPQNVVDALLSESCSMAEQKVKPVNVYIHPEYEDYIDEMYGESSLEPDIFQEQIEFRERLSKPKWDDDLVEYTLEKDNSLFFDDLDKCSKIEKDLFDGFNKPAEENGDSFPEFFISSLIEELEALLEEYAQHGPENVKEFTKTFTEMIIFSSQDSSRVFKEESFKDILRDVKRGLSNYLKNGIYPTAY